MSAELAVVRTDLTCYSGEVEVQYPWATWVILQSLVLSHYQRVTDRQTDKHAAYSQVTLQHS